MKNTIKHPSEFIPENLAHTITSAAAAAELQKKLHATQLDIIYQQNWFNMYVPREHGGLELSLPEILRIEEGLSWADGSTAWVVTLCSGAAWFIGFLDHQLIEETFSKDHVCLAGSGAITGTANKTSAGYEVNGYWKYATGSLHATSFTINCLIKEDGKDLFNQDGTPVVHAFLLTQEEVIVHSTWNCMGMIATGSHAIEVNKLSVPLNRAFIIDASHAKLPHLIFKYPFLQLAETTLAINISGMACRFIDLCIELISQRTVKDDLLEKVAHYQSKLNEYRHAFYKQSDTAWQALSTHGSISDSMLTDLSKVSNTLAYWSREIVNELYPYCGLTAADTRTEINRVWRNIHTAGQHSLFNVILK